MAREFRFDLHCHTVYSCDGNLMPERLMDLACHVGLGAIAITDHNTMKGVGVAQQQQSSGGPVIVPGEEISTEYGDIIGIFLNDVQRKEDNNISFTLVSGLFMVYSKFLTELEGIYYLDMPPTAKKSPYSNYMKPFSELITYDITCLLTP